MEKEDISGVDTITMENGEIVIRTGVYISIKNIINFT